MKSVLLAFLLTLFFINLSSTSALAQTTEICNNGIDDDGDNLIDCQDPDCPECNQAINCTQPNVYYLPPIYGNPTPTANALIYGAQDLILATRSANAIVTIKTPDGSFSQQVVLTSATSTSLTLPLTVVMSNSPNTKERNKGLILQSDEPIQATYRLTPINNQDNISLKGRAALGYAFYAASQTRLSATANAVDQRHFVSIMATETNTRVTIRSPVPLADVANPSSFTVSLNAGETYMVASPVLSSSSSSNVSISGLLVTSDKPIAVNAGSEHTYQPYSGNRDAGFDQMVPARLTGQQYVAVHGQNTTSNSDYVVVIAVEKATSITITGPASATAQPTSLTTVALDAGQVFTYNLTDKAINRAFQLTGNKRFYAFQVSSVFSNEFGMSILPSINGCTGNLRTDFFRDVGSTVEQALVVVPTAALASLKFNNQPYTNRGSVRDNVVVGGVTYSVVSFTASASLPFNQANVLTADQRFHVGVISGSSATGNFAYYSGYDAPVDVLNPATGQPTSFYRAAQVTPGQQKQHRLQLSSCGTTNSIRNVAGGTLTGSISIDPNDRTQLLYTMRSNAPNCGRDTVRVSVTNELGATGTVCLEFVNSTNTIRPGIAPSNPIVCRPTGAVSLTATASSTDGPYTYRWITADQQLLTTSVISTTSTGRFRLTVTDAAGCQDTTSVLVNGDTPTISLVDASATACQGLSRVYSVSSTAGTYSWSVTGGAIVSGGTPTSTTAVVNWTAASGVLRVVLTSANACTAVTSQTVTAYGPPTLSTLATPPGCFGTRDGQITLTASGGLPPYQYTWSTGATTKDLANLRAGKYTVNVTTSCTAATTTVRLSEPYPVLCPKPIIRRL